MIATNRESLPCSGLTSAMSMTDNGQQFCPAPRNRSGQTARVSPHVFGRICRESGVEDAYNHARRLKTLRGPAPYEHVLQVWTKELNPLSLDRSPHPATVNLDQER